MDQRITEIKKGLYLQQVNKRVAMAFESIQLYTFFADSSNVMKYFSCQGLVLLIGGEAKSQILIC